MGTIHERTAADLNRSFSDLGVRANITSTDDGVLVSREDARRLLAAISFHEGGSAQPLVGHLLQRRSTDPVLLSGDEGRHLWRALEDIQRSRRRNRQLDQGIIPGALSSAEALRFARRFPGAFRGGR